MFTKKIVSFFVITLFAFIYGASESNAQNVNAIITVKNIAVDATSQVVDTGIKVMPGDKIEISATGNTNHGANARWDLKGDTSKKTYAGGNFVFKNAYPFALVAWMGDTPKEKMDSYFQVSEKPDYSAQKGGNLFLAINDWGGAHYDNNKGGLTATVVLTRQYKIYADGTDANAAWGNGLVGINQGDDLKIHAIGKIVYWQGGDLRDPNGQSWTRDTLLAPQIKGHSVIGKIGNGSPFLVGETFSKDNVQANSWLYLTVNDEIKKSGSFTNNSGDLSFIVEVDRPSKAFKNPIN